MTSATATVEMNDNHVTVSLTASELPDRTLVCELACETRVTTSGGAPMSVELLRILCGSGLAFARSTLGIANGLSVTISDIHGTVNKADHVGMCHATAVAIARALGEVSRRSWKRWMAGTCWADFVIDGVRTELKTLSGVENETSNGISAAIANRVMNARGQASHVFVNGRGQRGITKEIAERGIRRAYGADDKAEIQSIRIIGPDFDITVPRR